MPTAVARSRHDNPFKVYYTLSVSTETSPLQLSPSRRADLSLEGLSVGDAFGERFFGPLGLVTARIERREVPPGPWPWTDDTEMALSIREVLGQHGRIVQDALALALARRFQDNRYKGYGAKAQEILESIGDGTPWKLASRRVFGGEGSLGNGAAMRAAPLGAWFAHEPQRIVAEARASAEVTHAHPEGQAGAIAVALAAAWAARGEASPLLDYVIEQTPLGATRNGLEAARRIDASAPVWLAATQLGAGERVTAPDTVPFALWCAARHSGDFAEALWATVSALGDRDTTCAIVGGVVALRAGLAGVPEAWRAARRPLPPTGSE